MAEKLQTNPWNIKIDGLVEKPMEIGIEDLIAFFSALPPDPKLQADLTAPIYEVRAGEPPKIYVEGKEDLIKRLGRSPDRGDAVIYSWAAGDVERMRNRKKQRHVGPSRQNSRYNPHRMRAGARA